jgi:hypothetical protein
MPGYPHPEIFFRSKVNTISDFGYLTLRISAAMLNPYKNLGALDRTHIKRLTRVERIKYEISDQQRSETEWKFGMETLLRTHS